MRQVPLALRPEPLSGLEAFVPGANAAALAWLASACPPAAPVYLWGPAGSGKTHLLRGWAQVCARAGAAVAWFDPLGRGDGSAPFGPDAATGPALLLFDDVHRLDPAAQHRAFAAMVHAQALGGTWGAAGDAPPVDLALREDLRTRIGWGHVFGLQPLDEAGTRTVLLREAARRGIPLGDEVLGWLLLRFERDLGSLMRLLDRLDDYALARARPVTVPLLRQMLTEDTMAPVA
jgi:DnaA family protein